MIAASHDTPGSLMAEIGIEITRLNCLMLQNSILPCLSGSVPTSPPALSKARCLILLALEKAPATPAQLARITGCRRQSTGRLVEALAACGLIEFEESHKRAKPARITEAGRRELLRAEHIYLTTANALGEGMDAHALAGAAQVLKTIRTRLESHTKNPAGNDENTRSAQSGQPAQSGQLARPGGRPNRAGRTSHNHPDASRRRITGEYS